MLLASPDFPFQMIVADYFTVKLVFECDFEITWSMGPLDLGTLGTFGLSDLFPPPHTFSYLLLTHLISISLVWFGKGGGEYLELFIF